MKKQIIFLLIAILSGFVYAQSGIKSNESDQQYFKHDAVTGLKNLESKAGRKLQVEWSQENSTPSFIGGRLTPPGYSNSSNKGSDGIQFLSENKELFGLRNPEQELIVISSSTDELSMIHIKYDQMINGIRIFPGQLIVHFNSDGSVESVNGNYLPTPIINTTALLSGSTAISLAKRVMGNYVPSAESYELILFRNYMRLQLAYEVKLPGKDFPDMKIIIDANSGGVISKDSGIRYDGPAVGSGIGLNGSTRVLNTYLSQGVYYLIDASLPMYVPPVDSLKGVVATYDAMNDTNHNGYDIAGLVYDPNNDNNFNDNTRLRAAVDAHFFAQVVYKFYKSHYNRNSYNNSGGSLISVVHYLRNYNNAFWNGSFMSYGDGDGVNFSNLAGALDVVAHELAHGVTGTTANLIYHVQPGAINESMSDVIGCLVDSTNWLIGEDIFTPNIPGDALRNMQNPHNGGTQGGNTWQPAHMNEYVTLPDNEANDWGGVHINSGITNKAFYNVASVIGHFKAGKIWYRALTVYLTNNSQFSNLRAACLSSASDLYGAASTEYTTVANGFTAVGITGGSGTVTDLTYDDGTPGTYVYETGANFQLAGRFTLPTNNCEIQNVKIYYGGDANNGSGRFTLLMYEANASGLPGNSLVTPFPYTPSSIGWMSFNVTGLTVTKDFFVSVKYDGINYTGIGADVPPGNGRAYEYDPGIGTWSKLTTPNDYTLFMRATVKSLTAVSEIESKVPDKFEITQNYPNPFNPSTTIRYALPEASDVKIEVFDINGMHITDLANNHQNPGTYTITWNGKNDRGVSVSSGVYYFRIQAGSFVQTNKMMLMK